jgi:hypothetical protein
MVFKYVDTSDEVRIFDGDLLFDAHVFLDRGETLQLRRARDGSAFV